MVTGEKDGLGRVQTRGTEMVQSDEALAAGQPFVLQEVQCPDWTTDGRGRGAVAQRGQGAKGATA